MRLVNNMYSRDKDSIYNEKKNMLFINFVKTSRVFH